MSTSTLLSLAGCLVFILSSGRAEGALTTIGGELVNVIDNCTPGDDSTCPSGHCCVKEGLAYIPEYTGPKPSHAIACKPYRKHGEFCYKPTTGSTQHEFCPCESALTCTSNGFFGHCQ